MASGERIYNHLGDTFSHGVNSSLEVSGYFDDTSGTHGYVRTLGGAFTTFDVPGATATYAYGLNDLGQVTGSYGSHGFLWAPGSGFTTFDPPGSVGTDPSGVNNAGAAVGFFLNPSLGYRNEGFVRNPDGTYTIFDVTGAFDTFASGINNLGDIAGSFDVTSGGAEHGFILLNGNGPLSDRLTLIDFPGGSMTRAFGINNLDEVFGTYALDGVRYAFIREAGRPLHHVRCPGKRSGSRQRGRLSRTCHHLPDRPRIPMRLGFGSTATRHAHAPLTMNSI